MRAVWLTEFGAPDRLIEGDAPDPVAGGGQVIVRVEFVNVTFVETMFRGGRSPGPFADTPLPMIPGNGVGGVVTAVGPGVKPGLIGRRVVTSTGGSGAYAEQVAVDASGLIEVPAEVELADAVALLADGRTALALIRAAQPAKGERVLVLAAAGGVGSLLVQLAHHTGATVVAAAGGDRKLSLARELGADTAVDYRQPDWPDRVRDAVGGVDVVFDGVGGPLGRSAFELVARDGRMFVYGLASGAFTEIHDEEPARRGVTVARGLSVTPAETRALAAAALAEAAAGRLRPVIGQRFPLADAAAAHAAIETRATVGKTLLVP